MTMLTKVGIFFALQFECNLFPLLRVNDLLRVRRTCKWAKAIIEDYLGVHPCSQNEFSIDLDEPRHKNALETILRQDNQSTIRKPLYRFNFHYKSVEALSDPRLAEILEEYASQIVYLKVSRMSIPMGSHELEFYAQLPRLENLTVQSIMEGEKQYNGSEEANHVVFPETFKTMKSLGFMFWEGATPPENDFFERLIEFCTQLESFRYPFSFQFTHDPNDHFDKLLEIFNKGEHKNFKSYDLGGLYGSMRALIFSSYDYGRRGYLQTVFMETPALQELSLKYRIKWLNVEAKYLTSATGHFLGDIASQVFSLTITTNCDNFNSSNSFPNVTKLEIKIKMGRNRNPKWMQEQITPEVFPNLRKMKLLESSAAYPLRLDVMWSNFLNLEELELDIPSAGDSIFLDKQEESGQPSFLQLTSTNKNCNYIYLY